MATSIEPGDEELEKHVNSYCLSVLHSGDLLKLSPYTHLYGLEVESCFAPQHKGDSGLVGVIGGSEDYTGAPYFASISALKSGADLSHIFCVPSAAPVIKSYNPDLIVHPLLGVSGKMGEFDNWLDRLNTVVIGPGLGRSEDRMEETKLRVASLRERKKGLIIDADGLFLLSKYPDVIRNYPHALLTPNHKEFKYLYLAATGEQFKPEIDLIKSVEKAANSLGNVSILCKGPVDIITNGRITATVSIQGSFKRCGGQGDILSGVCGTFMGWYKAREEKGNCEVGYSPVLAGIGGSILTRMVAREAGREYGVSLTTTNMVGVLPRVVHGYFKMLRRFIRS